MIAAGQARREAERRLSVAGIESAALDAVLLVAHAARLSPDEVRLNPARPLAPDAEGRLVTLLRKRSEDRMPVSRLLGVREFWSLPFALSPATLDPRPDSETVVDAVVRHTVHRAAPLRVFDIGVGSGCLLLSILSEFPSARGWGSDLSEDAAAAAQQNATTLGLKDRATIAVADGFPSEPAEFDWIVANPPYIPSADIDDLAPEVSRHDPRLALDGGPDGLAVFRAFAPLIARHLAPSGKTAVEFGDGQADAVKDIFASAGLECLEIASDLGGHERVIVAQRK